MVPNDRNAPDLSSGRMHYELRNNGDSVVLLYKAFDVFASGSLIITAKNKQVYIAGHQAGMEISHHINCINILGADRIDIIRA